MLQSLKLALKSIRANKMRSFLTMLGIIIGVASVIILVSLVNGYMSSMTESFESMGVNQVNVSVTNTASRVLDPESMFSFANEHREEIEYVTPVVSVQGRIKNGNETLSKTGITGYSEDWLRIKGYEIACGRNLSYADCEAEKKVCVLGYYTACTLFGTAEDAVSGKVKIGNNIFTCKGIVERQETEEMEEGGTDDFCWIPYTSAAKMNRQGNVSSYIFTIRDVEKAEAIVTETEDFLYETFKNEDLYNVTANSSVLDSMNEMIAMIEALLGGIAGISLLVAGVGVMNIMLVSVTERTREIGIRKALGAKKRTILTQFVIEAAVTSTLGGILGILVGGGLTGVIGNLIGITASPTLSAVLISFTVSVVIGLIFGYMPARRAAGLNPIEALRSE